MTAAYPTLDDFEGWYVVQTRGRAEAIVRDSLQDDLGIEVYLPMEKHVVRHARQTKAVERALIPRHLFAYIKLKGDFYAVKTAQHVTGMLCRADGRPALCDEAQLARLHLFEQLGEFDFTPTPLPDLEYGDRIMIAAGDLEGRQGEFTKFRGKDRAMVLLDAIVKGGRRYVADVDLSTLEAA